MSLSAAAETKTWSISTWDAEKLTADKTVDGLTIHATSAKPVTIDGSNKTIDGVTYSKRAKTGGTGDYTNGVYARVFSISIPGACKVSCAVATSNTTDPKDIIISFGGFATEVNEFHLDANEAKAFTAEYKGTEPTTAYFYCKKGAANFYGFSYSTSEEEPAPAEGEVFNVEGVNTQDITGTITTPCTVDFVNNTVTLENFLGSNSTVVCDLVKYHENIHTDKETGIQTLLSTVYSIVYKSGLTEDGDLYGETRYTIPGVNEITFTKDGVNTMKLENIFMLFSASWSVNCEVTETTNPKTFKLSLFMGGDYYLWNATDNTWSGKNPNDWGSQGFVNLKLNGTVAASGESGIADIVVDEDDANAPVEYYNLQGIRLNEPAAGQIVIRRQGSKVSKIVVR